MKSAGNIIVPPYWMQGACVKLRNRMTSAYDYFLPARQNHWRALAVDQFKRTGRGAGGYEVSFSHIYNPAKGSGVIKQLEGIWEKAWSFGIKDRYAAAPQLRELMLAGREQIRTMQAKSWDNIVVGSLGGRDGQIISGIWGNQLDVPGVGLLGGGFPKEVLGTYDLTTAGMTFANRNIYGNSLICVSVCVDPLYNGFKNNEGMSIGEASVKEQLKAAIRHPYILRLFAYSRLSSLSFFVGMLAKIKDEMGYDLKFSQAKECWAVYKNNQEQNVPVAISTGKIIIGTGKEVRTFSIKGKNFYPIEPTLEGFAMQGDKGQDVLLFVDDLGVYKQEGSTKKYLVNTREYVLSGYDQMFNFHTGLGAEDWTILPNARVHSQYPLLGDPIALGHVLPLEYDIGAIMAREDLFTFAYANFTVEQQGIIREAILHPLIVRKRLRGSGLVPKQMYFGFSREKLEILTHYFERHQRVLMPLLSRS